MYSEHHKEHIQEVSFPFCIKMFRMKQVEILKRVGPILLHFNATGSVRKWRGWFQRSAAIVVGTVVVLAIYNVTGNRGLMQSSFELPPLLSESPGIETMTRAFENIPFANLDLGLGRWDSSRTFKIFDNAVAGDRYSNVSTTRHVCLATQTSIESLQEILKLAAHWTGPISLAVLVVGDEIRLLQAFAMWLRTCESEIYSRLVLHVVTPAYEEAVYRGLPDWDRNCTAQPLSNWQSKMKTDEWKTKHPYPQNLLRNLARKNCQTPYVYMVDVDIVPSKGMAESLDQFLSTTQSCKLCAYVIPTYELDWSVPEFPSNKSALLQLVKNKLAVPFHKKVFIYNQLSSDLNKWEASRGNEQDETHISHDVTNYKLLYEPFYVAPDVVPPHDERFLGYGFTRNSQVYEMFLLGYQFKVLSPIFTIHWGLQSAKRPQWRMKQVASNYKKFTIFKKELYVKYHKDPLGLFLKQPGLKSTII